MQVVAKKRPKPSDSGDKSKRYPSRDKVKYIAIPTDLYRVLKGLGKRDERSASYMGRKAVQKFLTDLGQWPNPDPEILALADEDDDE